MRKLLFEDFLDQNTLQRSVSVEDVIIDEEKKPTFPDASEYQFMITFGLNNVYSKKKVTTIDKQLKKVTERFDYFMENTRLVSDAAPVYLFTID